MPDYTNLAEPLFSRDTRTESESYIDAEIYEKYPVMLNHTGQRREPEQPGRW